MTKTKAVLTKPLDGHPVGAEREFDKADFDTLHAMGAVRAADDLRHDGPTIAEYVEAGYVAKNYPPHGYASRSTPEEISAAVALQDAPPPSALASDDLDTASKAAPAPLNKRAPPAANKAAR